MDTRWSAKAAWRRAGGVRPASSADWLGQKPAFPDSCDGAGQEGVPRLVDERDSSRSRPPSRTSAAARVARPPNRSTTMPTPGPTSRLTAPCRREHEPGRPEREAAHVVQVDDEEREGEAVADGVREPTEPEDPDGAGKPRVEAPEVAAESAQPSPSVAQTSSLERDARDDLVRELRRRGVAAEVGGAGARRDRLERRPRGSPGRPCAPRRRRCARAARAPPRIIAIGLATFLPVERRRGSVRGLGHQGPRRVVLVEGDEERLGARDRAEEREDEVAEDVAVPVQRRDDERLAGRADEEREGRVDQLRLVLDLGMPLGGRVHLLLQHPLVDRARRCTWGRRRPWPSCAPRGGTRTRRRRGRSAARFARCGTRPRPRPRPRATPSRRRRRRPPCGRRRSESALRRSARRRGSGVRSGRSRGRRSPRAGCGSGCRRRRRPPASRSPPSARARASRIAARRLVHDRVLGRAPASSERSKRGSSSSSPITSGGEDPERLLEQLLAGVVPFEHDDRRGLHAAPSLSASGPFPGRRNRRGCLSFAARGQRGTEGSTGRSHVRPGEQDLPGRHPGRLGAGARDRGRRVHGPRRPVGLRQDDRAPHGGRPRGHLRGRPPDRRSRRQQRSAAGPRHRDGLPELRALPAPDASTTTSPSASGCARRRRTRSTSASTRQRRSSASSRSSSASRARSPAVSGSASRWAGRSCAIRRPSSWTSRSRTSTRSCACRRAPRSAVSRTTWERRRSTSRTTRSRR